MGDKNLNSNPNIKENVQDGVEIEENSKFSLNVSDDKMTVFLSAAADIIKSESFIEDVKTRMRFKKITVKLDLSALKQAINDAKKAGIGIKNAKIAEGVQPIKSVDGKIEWIRDFFKTGYYVDPVTKKIDFHQKVSDPAVEKDELLVKIFRARMGRNGRDVYGHAIIIPNPKDVNLKGGPNVYWDEEVQGFKANCDGRVKLRGKTLDVNSVYIARKGINAETGNIKHNGQVIVDGEVDSDFKIDATGDIEIRGLAYACDINGGGNLITKEGISSSLEKNIVIYGDIFTKYIQNTNVEAGGSITVNKEIYQCNVTAKGDIHCNEGRIIGGEVWATKGITVGEAGSKGNVKTLLVAGVDKELQNKVQVNIEEIKRIKEMIKKLETGYRKFKMNIHLLNDSQKESMTEITDKISQGEDEIERLNTEIKEFKNLIKETSQNRIAVLNIVYPGTVFRISDARYTVDQILAGPIYAVYDNAKSEIILTSKDEEKEIQKEEKIKARLEKEIKEKAESDDDESDGTGLVSDEDKNNRD
jgi:uncharacterized protein (DUF342 family)